MSKTTQGAKTPYEIRLELLQMAKDHLESTFQAQVEFGKKMTEALVAANKATIDELQKFAPKGYTVDDITKKAAELYSFILKKE